MLRHSARSSTTSSDHPRRCGGQTRCLACISAPPAKTDRSAFDNSRQTEACCSLQRSRAGSGRWSRYSCVLGRDQETAFVFGQLSYAPAVQNSEMSPGNAACVQNSPENTQRIRMSPENTRHPYNCLSPDSICLLNKKSLVGSRSEQLPTRDPQNLHLDNVRKEPLIFQAVLRCRAATRTASRNERPR